MGIISVSSNEFWTRFFVSQNGTHPIKMRVNLARKDFLLFHPFIEEAIAELGEGVVYQFKRHTHLEADKSKLKDRFDSTGQFTIFLNQDATAEQIAEFAQRLNDYLATKLPRASHVACMGSDMPIKDCPFLSMRYGKLKGTYTSIKLLEAPLVKAAMDTLMRDTNTYHRLAVEGELAHCRAEEYDHIHQLLEEAVSVMVDKSRRNMSPATFSIDADYSQKMHYGVYCQQLGQAIRHLEIYPDMDFDEIYAAYEKAMNAISDLLDLEIERGRTLYHRFIEGSSQIQRILAVSALKMIILDEDSTDVERSAAQKWIARIQDGIESVAFSDDEQTACNGDKLSSVIEMHHLDIDKATVYQPGLVLTELQQCNGDGESALRVGA